MKKKFLVLLTVSMLFSALVLAGCGDEEESMAPSDDISKVEETADEEVTSDYDEDVADETEETEDVEDNEIVAEEGLVDRRTDVQKYWNGDWYGWLSVLSTGAYREFNDQTYDTCGRIEVDENGDGTLTLWYGYEDGDTYDAPTGVIEIHIDEEVEGGTHGALSSTGGWMFLEDNPASVIEEGEIYVKPDEVYSPDCLYINYEYEDENGSISPLFALRPWGYTWKDDSYYENMDGTIPAFFKWYTPLIEDGYAQPDDFESEPTKTIKERELELIELAAGQDTPIRTDTDIASNLIKDDTDSDDDSDDDNASDSDSYYNDSTDFENELGSSRITHGFDKEIDDPEISGKSYSWGKLSVNIPDGMEAKDGGIADKNDENSLQVIKGTKYFIVSQRYELDALEDVSTTIEMNDADEVYVTVDGTEWEGAYYEYSGSPVWQIYATVDDACIEVMGYGFDFDSMEAQTVLATAKSTAPIWE